MTVPTDLSKATYDELVRLQSAVLGEKQKRHNNQELLDAAHSLVNKAKARGYNKAQVARALTNVVNQVYDNAPVQVEEPTTT